MNRPKARSGAEALRAYGNLKDEAVGFIRDAVVAGQLPPGSKVDQDDIADALGISRAPVREALIELAQKGFIDAVPRRGAFIAEVTAQDIADHYDITAQVLALSIRRAVRSLTTAQVDDLRKMDGELEATTDEVRRRSLNRRFFSTVVAAGRSRRIDSVLAFLGGALEGSLYYAAPAWVQHEAVFRRQLLDLIDRHDGRGASRLAVDHMHACARITIEHLTDQGYWPDRT